MKILLSSKILLFAVLLFSACKKDKITITSPIYDISFKKDGVSESINVYPMYCHNRPHSSYPGVKELTMAGYSKDRTVFFAISIMSNSDFKVGTYKLGDNTTNVDMIVDYFVNIGNSLNEKDFTIDNAPGQPPGYFEFTITSIVGKEVKGTFTSNYLYDRINNETMILKDGNFSIVTRE